MAEQLTFELVLPEERLTQLWTPDEIYDRINAENILNFIEDRRVERKSAAVQRKSMAEYLSMWSNTQPHGGLIIVGVDDDGKISGCKSASTSHINSIESLTELCQDARWASKIIHVKNKFGKDDFVIIYRVSYRPDKLVETSSLEAFIREGDKKLRITESLKRELRISKGEIHYELERVPLSYPYDFDINDIRNFCRTYYNNRRFQEPKSTEELLELAKLGKRDGNKFLPNLACALLFANDPRDVIPGARIRVIRYEGTKEQFGEQMNSVFSAFVDGNISKILFNAKPIVQSQLRSFQRFGSDGRISVSMEYPEEAWFEALVNAVAHRSYNLKNQNIFVKIFDDKFVVESPGGFVPPTTAATVYEAHNPRNPYLMEAMMHLELTFCGFEGTRRMRRAMESARLPEPRFHQIEAHSHQVHVTLENNIQTRKIYRAQNISHLISDADYDNLSKEQKLIIESVQKSGKINITHASLLTGISWPTASKMIQELVEIGVLELTSKRGKKYDASKTYRIKE